MNELTSINLGNSDSSAMIISTQDPEVRREKVDLIIRKVLGEENIQNHPDFILLENDNNSIGIDDIKGLILKIQYKPYRAKRKIAVINDAEKMTDEAQNAFLKTLEDIPARTIILISTSNYSYLLPTIISRCKVYEFSSTAEIEKRYDAKELINRDILGKFKLVEEIINSKNPQDKKQSSLSLIKTLTEHFRTQLHKDPHNTNFSDNLKLLQNTMTSISKNVNLRLALENLMINLK